MKMMNRMLLFASFWLLAVLMERNALVTAADQYDARHGMPPSPSSPLSLHIATAHRREATDHRHPRENVLKSHANPDRNHDSEQAKQSVIADAEPVSQTKAAVPNKDQEQASRMHSNELGEMQVGCGHGLFEVVPPPKNSKRLHITRKIKKVRRKREAEKMNERKRRNYHGSFTVWQPPVYQLTRPYIIPVWGVHGQQPLYFPPQPLYPDLIADPRKSYLPPNGYLPPVRTTTIGYDDGDYEDTLNPKENVTIGTRVELPPLFGDEPIWDVQPIQSRPTARPQTRPPLRTTQTPMRTRRPGVRTTTPPSLIHRSENDTVIGNTPAGSNFRPNSLRPQQERPSLVAGTNVRTIQDDLLPPNRQPVPNTTTQNLRPTQPSRAQPSACIWAIIICCQGNASNVNYSCFEQRGCTGAFWDKSPCDSDFARAAVNLAMQYYQQK